jgi:hypothetical protein
MPCTGVKAASHRVLAFRAQRPINEKMARRLFHYSGSSIRPRLGRPLQDLRAGGFGYCHYLIDFSLACDILRNTDAAIAVPNRVGIRILALCLAAPQSEHDASRFEEAHARLARPFRSRKAPLFVERCGLGTSTSPSVIRVMFGDKDNLFVVPAQAGIQTRPAVMGLQRATDYRIPAFAGLTMSAFDLGEVGDCQRRGADAI